MQVELPRHRRRDRLSSLGQMAIARRSTRSAHSGRPRGSAGGAGGQPGEHLARPPQAAQLPQTSSNRTSAQRLARHASYRRLAGTPNREPSPPEGEGGEGSKVTVALLGESGRLARYSRSPELTSTSVTFPNLRPPQRDLADKRQIGRACRVSSGRAPLCDRADAGRR